MQTSTLENMTPDQRLMPRSVHYTAYARFPMTCGQVRTILDEAMLELMRDLDIDPMYDATVDAAMSKAFQRIRDEVTQPFRTEQMRLIHMLQNPTETDCDAD